MAIQHSRSTNYDGSQTIKFYIAGCVPHIMAEVNIKGIIKEFDDGDIIAVDDVSFNIEDGEFLVIVGPSGCGKSTTLNCIAGLETPTKGDIYIGNEKVTNMKPQDRDIAMVFQNYALYPHKTVEENLGFGLKMRTDKNADHIEQEVREMADVLGIEDLLNQKPSELSGGQRQRVALGRAIVRRPKVFLLDEPLSNLDAKLRSQMRIELQQLHNEFNTTTIYVTHNQTEAMTMADKIAIMNGGKLQQIGTPLECYHKPNNIFVAGFLGSPSMNFFDVVKKDNMLVHSSFNYTCDQQILDRLPENVPDGLVLGIRPEDIKSDENNENMIKMNTSVVERLGDESQVYGKVGDDQITVTVENSVISEKDENINITFPPESIYLFDKSSQETLIHKSVSSERNEIESIENP